MFKLKRLRIEQYRNVKPGTELRFDDGLNLILGQNASGKTTLLALLSAVCRSAFDGIADEDFVLEYELRSERFTVTARVAHRRAEPSDPDGVFGARPRWKDDYEVLIEDGQEEARALIVSSLAPRPDSMRFSAGPEPMVMPSLVALIASWSFIAASLSDRGPQWLGLRSDLLQTFAFSYRFDESLDCFSAMTGR